MRYMIRQDNRPLYNAVRRSYLFYIRSIEDLSSTPCITHLTLLPSLLTPTIPKEPYSKIMLHKSKGPYTRLLTKSREEDDYDAIPSSPGLGLVKERIHRIWTKIGFPIS